MTATMMPNPVTLSASEVPVIHTPYLVSLNVAVSGTAAKPITVCGGNAACGDLNDSFGLPTVTLKAGAAANLVNITGSNIVFRDLELDPDYNSQRCTNRGECHRW
jgi:hypothetical protein